MLKNTTIKAKLFLLTIFTALGLIILIGLNQQAIQTAHNFGEVKALIEKLDIHMLELRKHEKDFLARKDLKYVEKFEKTAKKIIESKKELDKLLQNENIQLPNVQKFIAVITNYENKFYELVKVQQQIGLHPKDGLYGSLRASVHKVQSYAKSSNDMTLLAKVYDLRKQEKDFMLRLDTKYVNNFNKKHTLLLQRDLPQNEIANLEKYKANFLKLVQTETIKGLNSTSGLLGELRKTVHETSEIIHNLEKNMDQILEDETQRLIIFDLTVASIIMIIILGFIFFLSKNIATSLKNFQNGLSSFFSYLNREVQTVDNLVITGKDEINTMAITVNQNIKKIKEEIDNERAIIAETNQVLSQFEQGDFSSKITTQSSNQSLNSLTGVINQMGDNLEKNLDNILNVLNEFSHSNYVTSIDSSNLKAHFKKLALGVNELGKSISSLLKDSLDIGLTLQGSSSVLIENVNNLNTSSNETAASLEETAAALEEVTGTIINSAENVAQLNEYAAQLNQSAIEGQQQAQDTTQSMEEINEQVSSINEAITVIDQIAFQTNILSLNAAVEAATAGEAGKGFAVVAQEVRNLAARSAEAAKEIKLIVENATQKAQNGKQISSSMILGYDSLLSNITNATKKIDEIALASTEQKTGITQINDAITQLDRQTQTNASIANQTQDIANETDAISKEIVQDANTKEFLGKEEAQSKKITAAKTTSKSAPRTQQTTPRSTATQKVHEPKAVKKEEKKDNKNEVITANNNDDSEWESF